MVFPALFETFAQRRGVGVLLIAPGITGPAWNGSWGFAVRPSILNLCVRAPELERMLVRAGIRIFKFWFSVTQDEQRRRFKSPRA